MSELAPLIADLALILLCAGVMTLLFKKLKQPLVLGYIVAGFLASPHLSWTPSVVDNESVHVWADIGVIFLLFALGLEFSFKKIVKVGGSAVIAACTIIFCMIFLGVSVGSLFGWSRMDCLFLGGMLAMSSTTIIYKAFADLDLFNKQFTQLVMSILILEDILAIVLMVLLSTMAVSNNVEGLELLLSIGKLGFFRILWFVVGIWLIPLFLRKTRKLMSDETLLIVSLALCFFMVVIAAKTGFSAAFGAFIMGSILAETVEAEHIDHLVKPVKDLFGAIFFVSVGMMVDPSMIVEYAIPILVITCTILLGQSIFGSMGVLLSGQSLKTSMQCGFSLTQIGEFAFIIASLGVSLGVTSDFLYPIVVAVSVITTFLTPYMIRLAEPASNFVEAHMPEKWKKTLARYATGTRNVNHDSDWKRFLVNIIRSTVIYTIVCVAIVTIFLNIVRPFVAGIMPGTWGDLCVAVATICFLAPLLRAIMVKGNHSDEFVTLWHDNKNHAPLLATVIFRVLIAIMFIMFVMSSLFELSTGLIFGLALIIVTGIIISRGLKRQSLKIEKIFFTNLRSREVKAEYLGTKKPDYAGRLMSKDIHLADFEVPAEVEWVGTTLKDLNFGKLYRVHVVSILRGKKRINIPKANDRLYPNDQIQVIGTDADLIHFSKILVPKLEFEEEDYERGEMILRQFVIDENSPFLGKNMIDSGIRNRYHCMIVGVERGSDELHAANPHELFQFGDVVWIVGERAAVQSVVSGGYAISYD
ncbi:MAG: cation:proton antiporter [Bacteroidaceae bacterium]|nr:cation:proton antiporter [Bacteroidaceae bacterium]